MRILVVAPTVPTELVSEVPWHFFQELGALVEEGLELLVATSVNPQYELPGVKFVQIQPSGSWKSTSHLAGVSKLSINSTGDFFKFGYTDPKRWLRMIQWNQLIYRIAREWKPDVIHSHWAFPSGSAGYVAARQLKIPFVMTLRGIDHFKVPEIGYGNCLEPFYESTLIAALQRADAVSVCCTDSINRLEELKFKHLDRLHFLYHAVDASRFEVIDEEVENLRERLGLVNRKVIVCVGNYNDKRKGHSDLIRAMSLLKSSQHNPILLLVGGGPMREKLEEITKEKNLEKSVVFLGAKHPSEIKNYMRLANISVLPTYAEAFGNVVFESLLVGTPVVATRVGAPGDVLPKGPFGFTFSPGDADTLASSILEALDDEANALDLAAAGSDFVRNNMSLKQRASGFIKIYQEIMPK